ncbi:hypothetical protein [Streptomyces sp. NPDC059063]|uniref:hypothetical protein n=1 Tax=unclassified Streptomyces TaxID=2593676 RepID=UPI0036AAB76E
MSTRRGRGTWWSAVGTAAWVAVGTAAGALGAWQLASADSGGAAHSRPLDEGAVRRALTSSSARPTPSSAAPSPSKPRPSRPQHATVRFTGGTATVECRPDGTAYLLSWSPADGYHIDEDVSRGPAATVSLEAEANDDDVAEDVSYGISCVRGTPRPHPSADPDDD